MPGQLKTAEGFDIIVQSTGERVEENRERLLQELAKRAANDITVE